MLYAVADRTERIRRLAAQILHDRHESLGRLLQAALSGSEEALAQLIQRGDQRVVAPMVRVCTHGTSEERSAAIEVLIGTGPGQAICLLEQKVSMAHMTYRRLPRSARFIRLCMLLCFVLFCSLGIGEVVRANASQLPGHTLGMLFVLVVLLPVTLVGAFAIYHIFPFCVALMTYYRVRIGAHRLCTALTRKMPRLLCSRHLTRLHKMCVDLLGQSFPACRQCDTTAALREFGKVVVGLDRSNTAIEDIQGDTLWVNWLRYRQLFDFDEVELVDASEEDVERFDTQVRNDPDNVRRNEYKNMLCTIGPKCPLSENTLRSLRHTFGWVEIAQKGG